jgi:hypothetical protein
LKIVISYLNSTIPCIPWMLATFWLKLGIPRKSGFLGIGYWKFYLSYLHVPLEFKKELLTIQYENNDWKNDVLARCHLSRTCLTWQNPRQALSSATLAAVDHWKNRDI